MQVGVLPELYATLDVRLWILLEPRNEKFGYLDYFEDLVEVSHRAFLLGAWCVRFCLLFISFGRVIFISLAFYLQSNLLSLFSLF